MHITKDTRVSDILLEYADIAEVMDVFSSSGSEDIPCACFWQRP
jgi:hypothetical protein